MGLTTLRYGDFNGRNSILMQSYLCRKWNLTNQGQKISFFCWIFSVNEGAADIWFLSSKNSTATYSASEPSLISSASPLLTVIGTAAAGSGLSLIFDEDTINFCMFSFPFRKIFVKFPMARVKKSNSALLFGNSQCKTLQTCSSSWLVFCYRVL